MKKWIKYGLIFYFVGFLLSLSLILSQKGFQIILIAIRYHLFFSLIYFAIGALLGFLLERKYFQWAYLEIAILCFIIFKAILTRLSALFLSSQGITMQNSSQSVFKLILITNTLVNLIFIGIGIFAFIRGLKKRKIELQNNSI